MNKTVSNINTAVYNKLNLQISNFSLESESKEYDACKFEINNRKIICRNAKITPKKVGQFVTFWKRKENGPIEPFTETDGFDFLVVNAQSGDKLGQFVFPKSELIKKSIISSTVKEGKRAFRIYPIWDKVTSKQAERTQKWQLAYFFKIDEVVDFLKVKELFEISKK